MSTTPGTEKVFPADTSPAGGDTPPKSGKSGGLKLPKLNKNTAMVGGVGAVALFAFLSSRGGDEIAEPLEPAEFDTTDTDVVSRLEGLDERLAEMRDNPATRPARPIVVNVQQPKANGGGKKGGGTYTIKKGDKLWKIAKEHGVSNRRLFLRNKRKLNQAAIRRGHKHAHGGNKIFPGTKIAIPKRKGKRIAGIGKLTGAKASEPRPIDKLDRTRV